MEEIILKLSNEDLQKIKRKLEIKNSISNKNLVRFAIAEYLKKEVIR